MHVSETDPVLLSGPRVASPRNHIIQIYSVREPGISFGYLETWTLIAGVN